MAWTARKTGTEAALRETFLRNNLPPAGVLSYLGFHVGPRTMQRSFRQAVLNLIDPSALAPGYACAPGIFHPGLCSGGSPMMDSGRPAQPQLLGVAPLRIAYVFTNPVRRLIAFNAARQLSRAGIAVTVTGLPLAEMERDVRDGRYDLFVGGLLVTTHSEGVWSMLSQAAPLLGQPLPAFGEAAEGTKGASGEKEAEEWLAAQALLVPVCYSRTAPAASALAGRLAV